MTEAVENEEINKRPVLSEKATVILEYMKNGRYQRTRKRLVQSRQIDGGYDMVLKELVDSGYLILDDSPTSQLDWLYTLNSEDIPERIEQAPLGLVKAFKKSTFGREIVDARKLWEFLEVKTDFKDWIARKIEQYGFIENVDFSSFLSESTGGRPNKEYDLTLSMAKELCMIENNPMGKSARRYFIFREEQAKKLLAKRDGVISDQLESVIIKCFQGLELLEHTVASGFFQTAKKIEYVEHDVTDVKSDIIDVKTNINEIKTDVSHVKQRLEQVSKRFRQNFTKDTTLLHSEVIFYEYDGKCPCCNVKIVVNLSKCLTPDATKDHIDNDISNRSPYRTWIICSDCNRNKESKYDFSKIKTLFDAYQIRLKDYENKKKKKKVEQTILFN